MNIIEKKKRQMGQGGFTLIELLVVIAILAVLAGLAVIGIGAMRKNANDTACAADKDTVATAGEAYVIDASDPTTLSIATLTSSKLLKKAPKAAYAITVSADSAGTVTVVGCP